MNRNGNTYTFIYASVMVIVVAAILSFTAIQPKTTTKPQCRNRKETEHTAIGLAYQQLQQTPKPFMPKR
jgi:hypothetical protein